ncbi:hypothetical protein R3P38DRAFT_2794583 [Favolaschia claudopus]|uniref:Uncharacterized protein n=1 Tax=Favolaschia claudopus TaxID=2862362 RepID=A0AAV9ZZB7_9AGAR
MADPCNSIQTLQFEPIPKAIGAQLTVLSEFRFSPYGFRLRPCSKSTRPVRAFAVTLPWFRFAFGYKKCLEFVVGSGFQGGSGFHPFEAAFHRVAVDSTEFEDIFTRWQWIPFN